MWPVTTLGAGPFSIYSSFGRLSSAPSVFFESLSFREESCQESSALGFISELDVPDALGDASMSIEELSEALAVKSKYLSA